MAALALVSAVASAQIFNLTDAGSAVTIDGSIGTVTAFVVGGTDHAFAHTYYLRDGDGGTASGLGSFTLDSFSQPLSHYLELVYSNSTFQIQVRYLLTGAADQADLSESVVVRNISGQSAAMRLFQYSDWDMAGTAASDTVTRLNSSTMRQTDGVVDANIAVHGGTPIPDFTEMGVFPSIRDNITGTTGYYLDTAAGNGIGDSFTGDATYAFQWNQNLAPSAAFSMSTDKVVAVPEPGSMIALGFGAAALLARRRRKRSA